MVEADSRLDLASRNRVQLAWGSLFVPERVRFPLSVERELPSSNATLVMEQSWAQFIASAMTTMVVTLEFVRLVGDLVNLLGAHLRLAHFESLLGALETYHWHAVSFNANIPLRLKLHQRGFMNKNRSATNLSPTLPDLLEQEVAAAGQILRVLFRLNGQAGAEFCPASRDPVFQSTVNDWIQR